MSYRGNSRPWMHIPRTNSFPRRKGMRFGMMDRTQPSLLMLSCQTNEPFGAFAKNVITSSPALHSSLLFHSNSIRKSSFTIYKQGKDVIFFIGKTWCPDIRFSAIRMEAMTLREILGDSKVPEVKLQACCVPWLTGCHGR